jgi:uncharacterized damage-inducible protein DinB
MAVIDYLLPEFDHEMASTRKVLERIPAERFAWKPHVKSMSFGELAQHLAGMPGWIAGTIDQDAYEVGGPHGHQTPASSAVLLSTFDQNVAALRQAIASKTDAQLMAPWTMKANGKAMFTMPKLSLVRTLLLNHSIHHRGQLTVYLRLNDLPLPPLYGPTADERG